ncbi:MULTISPECIES: SGNH/GDSL hydrolase family protein [Pseudomonas]|uniref:SGNH/GDSL hydrolase family protein n=1 Tax=Pseudomonas guariconensis TaxID=1288410 RepID=UPI002096C749|nr:MULTISPECIES: SGNH/GDSL hydrolase family protein [Pseudomonas]MCO7594282.1 SGNH/GDSL hydrolase family protein [Pseudomonas guariconensis]MCU7219991.1 SGNH/GDSL hydrolase family protein [Pseudomonas brassicacearum]
MTDVESLEAYAGQLSEAAAKATAVAAIQHQVAHGDEQTDVLTESGLVPSLAKQAVLSQNKVNAALEEVASQLAGAMTFSSVAVGLEHTLDGGYFSVPSPDDREYSILYQNSAGVAIEIKRYPSALGVEELTKLVQGPSDLAVASEEVGVSVADDEGGEHLLITRLRLRTPAFEARIDEASIGIYGSDQDALLHADEQGISLGPLMFGTTLLPGMYVVDEEDAILQELSDPGPPPEAVAPQLDALAGGVYFAPKLVTAPGAPLHLDVSSMIAPRGGHAGVVASISSDTTSESQSSTRTLKVQASKFGSSGRLKLRASDNALTQHIMDLSFAEIPTGPFNGAEPNVLVIGDSISNRQGAQFLKETLTDHGYNVNFIGTMNGSAIPDGPTNVGGPLGECREVYSTGNYTYAVVNEITIPIEPGMEAEYLAMSKTPKRNHNPFIRAATAGDDPSVVRNGYVLDFAFYQSRFSLPAPDIIVYALGMNDFLQTSTGDELFNYVLDNERLMMQRIRAAWPSVKILRCLPGLPYHRTRNQQWTDRYISLIRGVMSNLNTLGDPRNILVPSWTFANPETGYATGNSVVDPVTGVSKVEITDMTHPVGANRRSLFQGIAPYIVAATLNFI